MGPYGWRQKIGLRRGLPSGHYQRHLDKALDFKCDESNEYVVKTPGHPRSDVGRVTMDMPIRLAYEQLESEANEHPEIRLRLRTMIEKKCCPVILRQPSRCRQPRRGRATPRAVDGWAALQPH